MTETSNRSPGSNEQPEIEPSGDEPVSLDTIAFTKSTSHELTDEGRGFLTLGALSILLLVVVIPPASPFQLFLLFVGVVMPVVLIWRILTNPQSVALGTTTESRQLPPQRLANLTTRLSEIHSDTVTVSGSVKLLFRRVTYQYTFVPQNLHRIQPIDGLHAPRALAAFITGLLVFLLGVLIDPVILLVGIVVLLYAVAISLHKAPGVIEHSSSLAGIIRVGIPVILGIELLTIILFVTGVMQIPIAGLEGGVTSTIILVLFSVVVELELPRDGIKLTRPDAPTEWIIMNPTDAYSLYYEIMNTNPDATPFP